MDEILCTGSDDCTAIVFNILDGKVMRRLGPGRTRSEYGSPIPLGEDGLPVYGHTTPINCICESELVLYTAGGFHKKDGGGDGGGGVGIDCVIRGWDIILGICIKVRTISSSSSLFALN